MIHLLSKDADLIMINQLGSLPAIDQLSNVASGLQIHRDLLEATSMEHL